jgi:hypothetical protein
MLTAVGSYCFGRHKIHDSPDTFISHRGIIFTGVVYHLMFLSLESQAPPAWLFLWKGRGRLPGGEEPGDPLALKKLERGAGSDGAPSFSVLGLSMYGL